MIKLRNSLTHFFSLNKHIQLAPPDQDKEARKVETQTNNRVIFLSPIDLYNLVRGAGLLLIDMWTKDYDKSLKDKTFDYKKKMLLVQEMVFAHGALTIRYNKKTP
jgi:hypothetical protein